MYLSKYIIYKYKLIEADPRSVIRKMRHETGRGDETLRIPVRQSPVPPRQSSANLFQDDDELFFLGHQLGYLPSS